MYYRVAMGDTHDPGKATQALLRDEPTLTLRSHKVRLEVLDGPDAGKTFEAAGPTVRVGGGRENEIVVSDPTVSRHHVSLRIEDGEIRVLDAGSRNGTRVDGLRVRDCYARLDSVIAIGRTSMRLKLLADVVDVPLSSRRSFGGLLGGSVAMRQLFALLERVAPTETTVLIEGETGTGKELIAEAIHEESRRAGGPYVVFDCSAISAQLIESELFGHVRGSFTGAVSDRVGAIGAADGGTLFLDEIGELPLDLQPKLLRALERREVRRVGTHTPQRVDVRVIAATNRSMAEEVERGRFREDLYYRLAVVRVVSPPLRERPEDIDLLAHHFAAHFASRHRGDERLSERTLRQFRKMAWPGNARELRNAVERVLSLGQGTTTRGDELVSGAPAGVLDVDLTLPLKEARDRLAESFERAYITQALAEAGGNVTRAAEIARVHRKFIHRAIKRYGLREDAEGDRD